MDNTVKIVVGSWYRYNSADDDLALGSNWIDLSEVTDEDELKNELEKQGFELGGLDEELFLQDIEGFEVANADLTNPFDFANMIWESEILDDPYKYNVAIAYCEVNGERDFENLVSQNGSRWDDDIYFYDGASLDGDFAYDLFDEVYGIDELLKSVPSIVTYHIDWEGIANELSYDGYYETSTGVIEFR